MACTRAWDTSLCLDLGDDCGWEAELSGERDLDLELEDEGEEDRLEEESADCFKLWSGKRVWESLLPSCSKDCFFTGSSGVPLVGANSSTVGGSE